MAKRKPNHTKRQVAGAPGVRRVKIEDLESRYTLMALSRAMQRQRAAMQAKIRGLNEGFEMQGADFNAQCAEVMAVLGLEGDEEHTINFEDQTGEFLVKTKNLGKEEPEEEPEEVGEDIDPDEPAETQVTMDESEETDAQEAEAQP
jgi:hypothetical protein